MIFVLSACNPGGISSPALVETIPLTATIETVITNTPVVPTPTPTETLVPPTATATSTPETRLNSRVLMTPEQQAAFTSQEAAFKSWWDYWSNANPPLVDPNVWAQRIAHIYADPLNPTNLGVTFEFPGQDGLYYALPFSNGAPVTTAETKYNASGGAQINTVPLRPMVSGTEADGTQYQLGWYGGRWVRVDANNKTIRILEVVDNDGVFMKMVATELKTSGDLKNLPVIGDDTVVFESGEVQGVEEDWLIKNVLPKADIKLPTTWRINKDKKTGLSWMDYNAITEPNVVDYRGVCAFFVMHNGIKMLRLGFEYGGPGQLIHFNLENSKWWTDPERIKNIIAAFNRDGEQMLPIIQYGTETAFAPEKYNNEVNLERLKGVTNYLSIGLITVIYLMERIEPLLVGT